MSRARNIFERRGWGWGWKNEGMLTRTIAVLRVARNAQPLTDTHRRAYRIGINILGQYAHDNACDVEGFPIYAGKIGELRKLCEIVGVDA